MGNLNPIEFLSMIKRGNANPQQLAMSLVSQMAPEDPMLNNLIQLAQSGNTNDLIKIAEQYFSQNGTDLNSQYNNMMRMLK